MFFVFYVFYLRKYFIGAISDQFYPSNFIIPIDTHYISTEKRTAIASDVWFFAICSTKRAVSCLPHCKMNCILAGGFAVSVQQYQFRRKLSGAMTSVTNIHHFSDGDVRQGLRISFGQLGFANHDQPSAPAFAIRARHKQKATNFLSSVAPQNLFQPSQRSVHLRTHNVHMPVAAMTTLASSILGSGLGSELAWL